MGKADDEEVVVLKKNLKMTMLERKTKTLAPMDTMGWRWLFERRRCGGNGGGERCEDGGYGGEGRGGDGGGSELEALVVMEVEDVRVDVMVVGVGVVVKVKVVI